MHKFCSDCRGKSKSPHNKPQNNHRNKPIIRRAIQQNQNMHQNIHSRSIYNISQNSYDNYKMNQYQGLPNIGNTCFLNSAIQFLYSSMNLREKIKVMSGYNKPFEQNIKDIFQSLQSQSSYQHKYHLMQQLTQKLKKMNINYQQYSQQDSLQFLLIILTKLFEKSPIIQKLFQLYYKITCPSSRCNYTMKFNQFSLTNYKFQCEKCNKQMQIKFINSPKCIILQNCQQVLYQIPFYTVKNQLLSYKLKAKLIYSGNGQSGHYKLSRRKQQNSDQFYIYNDSYVYPDNVKYQNYSCSNDTLKQHKNINRKSENQQYKISHYTYHSAYYKQKYYKQSLRKSNSCILALYELIQIDDNKLSISKHNLFSKFNNSFANQRQKQKNLTSQQQNNHSNRKRNQEAQHNKQQKQDALITTGGQHPIKSEILDQNLLQINQEESLVQQCNIFSIKAPIKATNSITDQPFKKDTQQNSSIQKLINNQHLNLHQLVHFMYSSSFLKNKILIYKPYPHKIQKSIKQIFNFYQSTDQFFKNDHQSKKQQYLQNSLQLYDLINKLKLVLDQLLNKLLSHPSKYQNQLKQLFGPKSLSYQKPLFVLKFIIQQLQRQSYYLDVFQFMFSYQCSHCKRQQLYQRGVIFPSLSDFCCGELIQIQNVTLKTIPKSLIFYQIQAHSDQLIDFKQKHSNSLVRYQFKKKIILQEGKYLNLYDILTHDNGLLIVTQQTQKNNSVEIKDQDTKINQTKIQKPIKTYKQKVQTNKVQTKKVQKIKPQTKQTSQNHKTYYSFNIIYPHTGQKQLGIIGQGDETLGNFFQNRLKNKKFMRLNINNQYFSFFINNTNRKFLIWKYKTLNQSKNDFKLKQLNQKSPVHNIIQFI